MYDCLPEFIDAAYAKMAEEAGSGFDSRKYSLAVVCHDVVYTDDA